MDPNEAREYLASLINQNFRVCTTDGRMFVGSFKCTDPDRNIVLAHTYEYRPPSAGKVDEAHAKNPDTAVTLDMTSRYLGLVVVPGHYIVKMELEQFASQMKKSEALAV